MRSVLGFDNFSKEQTIFDSSRKFMMMKVRRKVNVGRTSLLLHNIDASRLIFNRFMASHMPWLSFVVVDGNDANS